MGGFGEHPTSILFLIMKQNATKLVSSALLGIDGETIIIGGKAYYITPPTIKRIMGAGLYLSEFGNEKTMGDYLANSENLGNICKALSWFIQGDEKLSDKLSEGTLTEVVGGLETALALLDIRNFLTLSRLTKSVRDVIAKEK